MSSENLEKKRALEVALGQIEKQFGKGAVMKLGEFTRNECRSNFDRSIGIRYCFRNRGNS